MKPFTSNSCFLPARMLAMRAAFVCAGLLTTGLAAQSGAHRQGLDLLRPSAGVSDKVPESVLRDRIVDVDVNLVRFARPGHVLRIAMFDDAVFEAVLTDLHVEPKIANSFHWTGTLRGYPNSSFVLTVHEQAFAGWIFPGSGPHRSLSIVGEYGHYHARETDDRKHKCGGGLAPEAPPPVRDEVPLIAGCDDPLDSIDVLLLYDNSARSRGESTTRASILNALAQGNEILRRSALSMRWVAADLRHISYTGSGSTGTDLGRLQKTTDSYLNAAHSYRKTAKADVVALVCGNVSGNTTGTGYCIGGANDYAWAFSVSSLDALSSMTLAHELGHNHGCAHNPEHIDCHPVSYGRGHWFWYEDSWPNRKYACTVMSYDFGWGDCSFPWICSRTRQANFSNPNVSLSHNSKLFATGTSTKDNARVIRERRQNVANYSRHITGQYGSPTITTNPAALTLNLGYNSVAAKPLTVAATNATKYQWRRNNVNIAGQTGTTLQLDYANVTAAMAGSYDCAVTNECASQNATVYSAKATITVTSSRVTRSGLRGDFGTTMTRFGDFNGDGFEDYAVGGPTAVTGAGSNSGIVTMHSGKDQKLIWNIDGPVAGAMLGTSLASADFNQDGYADLFIGGAGPYSGWASNIYFFSGKARTFRRYWGDSNAIAQHMGTGYFNANKYPDIVANYGSNAIQALDFALGRLWLVTVAGPVGSLAVIGDFNGDGLNEVLVGIPAYNNKAGRYEIRSGKDGKLLFSRNGTAGEEFGYSVAAGGNLGGGWGFDYAVGGPGYSNGAGRVRFFHAWNNAEFAVAAVGPSAGRFGLALAGVGDQDGDGHDDVAVSGMGFVRFVSGRNSTALRAISRPSASFGRSLAAIDTSGDSKLDLVVGEPGANVAWCYDAATVANPPQWRRYGATCAGTGGRLPRIFGATGSVAYPQHLQGALARSGGSVSILLNYAAKNSAAILRLGVVPSELPLDGIGMPGCVHLIHNIVSFGVGTDRNGAARFGPLPIQSDPRFVGGDLLWQWLVIDTTANSFGLTMSDAAVMRIGAKL